MRLKVDMYHRTVESNLVILCGCLPTLRIFLRHTLPGRMNGNAAKSCGVASNVRGFSLRTVGQSARSRRHFDMIAEIDAMDDMDLKENTCDYEITINNHSNEESSRKRSEEGIAPAKDSISSGQVVHG